ncbi:MAG: ATP-binding cassette domain-containing protein, partial [Candidatus Oxydemutatoraceae bacterium WSBS_2016_MAG_OTU14]
MSDIILKVENLNIGLSPDKLLLHNVSFDIRSGETYALVGESGSGKTLSAFSVVRLLPEGIQFYSGAIKFLGEDLLRMPECKVRKLRGNDIAFVFQEPSTALNPVLTIGQQIGEILD